jgi:hypothetical protein
MTRLRVVRSALSASRRARFIRHMKNAQRRIGRLEDRARAGIRRDLELARRSLLAALVGATEFQQWHLPQVLAAVNEVIDEYETAATRGLAAHADEAFQLGAARTASAARVVGVDVPALNLPIPRDILEVSQGFVADLVHENAEEIRRAIGREIRLSAAGGLTREDLIGRVQKQVTSKLRFRTRRARAETIVRTELNRVESAAHFEGMKRAQAENVKVRKMWVASPDGPEPTGRVRKDHWTLNGVVVDVEEPFPYPGLPKSQWPQYPGDPVLPAGAAVNERCTFVEIFEVIEGEDPEGLAVEIAA